ncbi:MAG: hypothetical protein BYD32DRAFT_20204 [Podila humilis]|nr:MAG: hypothetical protein BYD32DRAFT_20204 [Podila humilis]
MVTWIWMSIAVCVCIALPNPPFIACLLFFEPKDIRHQYAHAAYTRTRPACGPPSMVSLIPLHGQTNIRSSQHEDPIWAWSLFVSRRVVLFFPSTPPFYKFFQSSRCFSSHSFPSTPTRLIRRIAPSHRCSSKRRPRTISPSE